MNLNASIFYAMEDNEVIEQHVDLLVLMELLIDQQPEDINYFKWNPHHGNAMGKINVVKSGAPEHLEYEALDSIHIGDLNLNTRKFEIHMVTLPSEIRVEDDSTRNS